MRELKPGQIGCSISRDINNFKPKELSIYIQFKDGCSYTNYIQKAKIKAYQPLNVKLIAELERVISNFYRLEEENARLKDALKDACRQCTTGYCPSCSAHDLKQELGL